jgi:hypothetical protein
MIERRLASTADCTEDFAPVARTFLSAAFDPEWVGTNNRERCNAMESLENF